MISFIFMSSPSIKGHHEAVLPRVGLVEVRACFWGCMIQSPAFYRVFVLLEFKRAKRANFLKDTGMVSVNPKRHKHPGGVTIALAVAHVLESNVLGTCRNHVMLELHLEKPGDFEDPL